MIRYSPGGEGGHHLADRYDRPDLVNLHLNIRWDRMCPNADRMRTPKAKHRMNRLKRRSCLEPEKLPPIKGSCQLWSISKLAQLQGILSCFCGRSFLFNYCFSVLSILPADKLILAVLTRGIKTQKTTQHSRVKRPQTVSNSDHMIPSLGVQPAVYTGRKWVPQQRLFRCVYSTASGWMRVSTCWEGTGSAKRAVRINISSVTHYTPGEGGRNNEGKNALWCSSIYSMCRFGV